MGGRNAYVWASRHPQALKGLVIVDTGPETGTTGLERMRVFRELPDELDSFEEFAQRVQQYTGRSREQTLGSPEIQHSAASRRQVDLEVRQAPALFGPAGTHLDAGTVVGLRGPRRLPHLDSEG